MSMICKYSGACKCKKIAGDKAICKDEYGVACAYSFIDEDEDESEDSDKTLLSIIVCTECDSKKEVDFREIAINDTTCLVCPHCKVINT